LAELISDEELEQLVRSASFRCPHNPPRDPRDCDGRACPVKPDNPMEDYYHECVEALAAQQKLRRILAGELRVASPIKLIKLRRRLKRLIEKKPVKATKRDTVVASSLFRQKKEAE